MCGTFAPRAVRSCPSRSGVSSVGSSAPCLALDSAHALASAGAAAALAAARFALSLLEVEKSSGSLAPKLNAAAAPAEPCPKAEGERCGRRVSRPNLTPRTTGCSAPPPPPPRWCRCSAWACACFRALDAAAAARAVGEMRAPSPPLPAVRSSVCSWSVRRCVRGLRSEVVLERACARASRLCPTRVARSALLLLLLLRAVAAPSLWPSSPPRRAGRGSVRPPPRLPWRAGGSLPSRAWYSRASSVAGGAAAASAPAAEEEEEEEEEELRKAECMGSSYY